VKTIQAPGKLLGAEEIYVGARRSVVIVGGITKPHGHRRWHASCATGFVVNKNGVIITNAHVVEAFRHMKAIGIMTDDGRVFPVKKVLAADLHNDVTALEVEANDLTPLPIAENAPVGSSVYCLSHPALDCEGTEHGFYTYTRGMVCGKFRLRLDNGKAAKVLAITADYAQGSSGGPILNEYGAVVGVVCSTMALCSGDETSEIQMTWKFTRPSSCVLALLRGSGAAK
jgi:S1-C subfamily serine protease